MLYMIVEHFRNGDPKPVYARFRDKGRLAPEGLKYINSWVTDDLAHCYQVMECDDRSLLDQWLAEYARAEPVYRLDDNAWQRLSGRTIGDTTIGKGVVTLQLEH